MKPNHFLCPCGIVPDPLFSTFKFANLPGFVEESLAWRISSKDLEPPPFRQRLNKVSFIHIDGFLRTIIDRYRPVFVRLCGRAGIRLAACSRVTLLRLDHGTGLIV